MDIGIGELIVDENIELGWIEELYSDDCNGFRFFKELKLFSTMFLIYLSFGDLMLLESLVSDLCIESSILIWVSSGISFKSLSIILGL